MRDTNPRHSGFSNVDPPLKFPNNYDNPKSEVEQSELLERVKAARFVLQLFSSSGLVSRSSVGSLNKATKIARERMSMAKLVWNGSLGETLS